MDGYCIAGQQPVFPGRQPVDMAAEIDFIAAAVKAGRAKREAELAAQRAALVAESLILFATVKTRDQVRGGWEGQLLSAQRELDRLDNTQRWGRWTQAEFDHVCAPARQRYAEALRALAELAS